MSFESRQTPTAPAELDVLRRRDLEELDATLIEGAAQHVVCLLCGNAHDRRLTDSLCGFPDAAWGRETSLSPKFLVALRAI